jgi:hypothetical protein
MKRFSLFLSLMLGLVQGSFSQSEFLPRGQNGYGGGFGLSTNHEGNGLNFYAGYSYRGFLDGNLSYTKSNGGKVQGGVLSPSVTYYIAKQEDVENLPTLGISVGYERYKSIRTTKVEEQNTDGIGWHWHEIHEDQKVNALKLGVTAEHRIGYWSVWFFQPIVGAGLTMKNGGWEFTLRGGVSCGTRLVPGPLLIITPSFERRSGVTTFVLTVGAVFQQ